MEDNNNIKSVDGFVFYEDSWNPSYSNNITKNQALSICDSLYDNVKSEECIDDLNNLRNYIKNK